MLTLILEEVEINSLISILKDMSSILWSKVWYSSDQTVGVFVQSSPGTIGSVVMNVILDYENETRRCSLTIMGFGGGERFWFHDLLDNTQRNLRKKIIKHANNKGWKWEEFDHQIQVIRCPNCHARYLSEGRMSVTIDSTKCQKCGKEFGPVRISSEDWSPEGIRCPFCRTVDFYKEFQIDQDRRVTCQTCGKVLQLDALKHERFVGFPDDIG
ncbi:MAG: hypothetical protein ACFFEE_08090 [Candidatus Thorarchaeota archaeon]